MLGPDQVIILFALQSGFLEDTEPARVRTRLAGLVKQVHQNRPDLVEALIEKKDLTDEIKEGLNEQLSRFSDSTV